MSFNQPRLSGKAASKTTSFADPILSALRARDRFLEVRDKNQSDALTYPIENSNVKQQIQQHMDADEEHRIRQVFKKLESPRFPGKMSLWKLRTALRELNQSLPPEDELLRITEEDIEDNGSGMISLEQLFTFLIGQKSKDRPTHDDETVSAFKALGGREDKTGTIESRQLEEVIVNFGFSIDIQALIREIDDDESGTVDYDEFFNLLYSEGSS